MSDYVAQFDQLLVEAQKLPYCQTRVALLQEAVRVADLHNDLDRAYAARQELLPSALFTGRVDIVMVEFAWMVAAFDRQPGRFDEHRFLWRYKWVAGNSSSFPQISRAKGEELFNDFERRCDAASYGQHAVATSRRDYYVDLHDVPAAIRANDAYVRSQRDQLSDCPACVVEKQAAYHDLQLQWEEQLQAIEPLFSGQVRCCSEQPIRSVSRSLMTLVRLGRMDEARKLQMRHIRQLKKDTHHADLAALHLSFLALAGQRNVALKFFNHYQLEAFDSVVPLDCLRFLRAGIILLESCLAQGETSPVKLRPHALLPPADPQGSHEPALLRDWMQTEALRIAAAYDARNGNDWETRATLECPALVAEFAVP